MSPRVLRHFATLAMPAVLAGALAVSVALVGAAHAPAARAASTPFAASALARAGLPDDQLVRVDLEQVSPTAVSAGETVTFAGQAVNVSDTEVRALNAYVRVSAIPVTDAADLPLIEDPAFRSGFRTAFFQPAGDVLATGDRTSFRVTAPVDDLPFTTDGVYVIGIEIRATTPDGTRATVGRSMTTLPYTADPDVVAPVGIAWAWPLSTPVDRDADGTFRSDDVGAAMETSGALGEAIRAAGNAPVTWFVDPAVVLAAADMADGYEVLPVGAETPTAGAHQAAAERWLTAIRSAAAAGRVELLPYANADLVALVRAGLQTDAVAALEHRDVTDIVPGAMLDLVFPPGGAVDADTLAVLGGAGVRHVVLSSDSLKATDDDTRRVRLSAGDKHLVALRVEIASGPSGLVSGADLTNAQQRQLFLARTALQGWASDSGAELPHDPTAPPSTYLVLAPPTSATAPELVTDLLDLADDVPWLTAMSVADATTGDIDDGALSYPDTARAAELSTEHLQLVRELRARIDAVASLTGGPLLDGAAPDDADSADNADAAAADAAMRLVLRAESAAWRTRTSAARAFIGAQLASYDAVLASVHVASNGPITLSSSKGRFPLTVRNGLDQPVTVDVELRPREPGKFRASEPERVAIGAGQLATVDVSAEAGSNGTFVVDVQLRALNGAVVGSPAELTVRATDYDTVAWIVIAIAGGLLFGAVGFRLVRRIIRARRAA